MNEVTAFSQAIDDYVRCSHLKGLRQCTLADANRIRFKRGVFDKAETLVKMNKRWYNSTVRGRNGFDGED